MGIKKVSHIQQALDAFRANKKWYRRWVKRSSVALILREADAGVEVLMIKRADREGDRWSGQMAFPGGRTEKDDRHVLHTACRETWEEIGFDIEKHGQLLGRLSDLRPHIQIGMKMLVITPYVFSVDEMPELNINHEVSEVVWVPLSFLSDEENRQTVEWELRKMTVELPCYFYQGKQIWGLSLSMLDELMVLQSRMQTLM